MKFRAKAILATTMLAAGTLGTATAFAATTNSTSSSGTGSTPAQHAPRSHQGSRFDFGAASAEIAKILGIDQPTLKSDIQAGQTLAQIAQAQGISEQTLISDLEADFKQHLDQAVQNGKLTADKEQTMLQKFDANVQKLVESKLNQIAKKPEGFGPMPQLAEVANILGIDQTTLKSDLQSGQTLAQIANSKGISEQTLISDLESALKQKLDQAVQNGKLTSQQEQQMLQKFESNAQKFVESKFAAPLPKGPGGFGDLNQIAQILGVDKQTLLQDLKNGQSIAQVAESKGISVDSLVSQLVSNAKSKLDQAVQRGKLTAGKEQQILDNLQQRLTQLVQNQGPFGHPGDNANQEATQSTSNANTNANQS
ncbi:LysM peptidoglycan-binding domain-containing protein [Alicyclobacillus macrosporangiidus]|uniref:LysM peptidoglycan-binding domain-containing protein n=1 Tax=Alicyclobacillus macrosporangiidus TaxID=392015 RepID=UPI0004969807|nr:LysM peptidoglycan-binding domain-containing protein [Alicyclobacillus macrosporangiidus]